MCYTAGYTYFFAKSYIKDFDIFLQSFVVVENYVRNLPYDKQHFGPCFDFKLSSFQVSFLSSTLRNQHKFYEWITQGIKDCLNDLKIDKSALEILGYLAYETVGQVVELSLIARKDMQKCADVLVRTMPYPITCNMRFPKVQVSSADTSAGTVLKKRLLSGDAGAEGQQKDEEKERLLLDSKPLKVEHVLEGMRKLNEVPQSVFYKNNLAQKEQLYVPILAL